MSASGSSHEIRSPSRWSTRSGAIPTTAGSAASKASSAEASDCVPRARTAAPVCRELSERARAVGQPADGRQEEQSVAEDARDQGPQRIAQVRVVAFMIHHRVKLIVAQHSYSSGRDVDARAQQPGAERLRARVVEEPPVGPVR